LQVKITSEESRVIERKSIRAKIVEKLCQTHSPEFNGKRFMFDGKESLYTIGPLRQETSEFTVILEESFGLG